MSYKKWIYLIFGFIIFGFIVFINLGRFFDITDQPRKVDIIVYLGGGSIERIEKTLELYQKGYSKTNKIIYTGHHLYHTALKNYKLHDKKEFFISHGVLATNLIHGKKNTGNTVREVMFVKKYMLSHHLHSVIFVTDPPHSRRVKMLAEDIANYKDAKLKFFVVGTDVAWWKKSTYFLERNALVFVASEMIKLPYNYFTYGILKKYGLLQFVKDNFKETFDKFKSRINRFIQGEWE